ncbi:hypothetical protein CP532_1701 [Ophiocordyceps camponoti-leonardi (nom. inval.)]|nr:hypothetical protein CP532_1701 [Ophiocordyceps camponoti-leonardi (nom. inval.)]
MLNRLRLSTASYKHATLVIQPTATFVVVSFPTALHQANRSAIEQAKGPLFPWRHVRAVRESAYRSDALGRCDMPSGRRVKEREKKKIK